MKKKIIISISALLIIVIGVALFFIGKHLGWFYKAGEQQIRDMTEINEANSIIMYYGDMDPGKEVTLNYRKINEISEETIGDPDNQYYYHAIVIFDFDGKMSISNEELMLIKKYCENKHYDMLYYGRAHLKQFKDCGFFQIYNEEEDYGFTYNGSYWINRKPEEEYLNPYLLLGNWSKDDDESFNTKDKHMMWKIVISYINGLVKDSMGS